MDGVLLMRTVSLRRARLRVMLLRPCQWVQEVLSSLDDDDFFCLGGCVAIAKEGERLEVPCRAGVVSGRSWQSSKFTKIGYFESRKVGKILGIGFVVTYGIYAGPREVFSILLQDVQL